MQATASLDHRLGPDAGIDFVGMGINHTRQGVCQIIPNSFYHGPHFSLLFNHSSVAASVDGVKREFPANTLCLWDSSPRVFYGAEGQEWRISWFQFFGEKADQLLAESGAPVNHPTSFPDAALVDRYWVALHQEFTRYAKPDASLILNHLNGILLELARAASPGSPAALIPEHLARIRSHIDLHYLEDFTLTTLAAKAHLAPAYLSRAFKECFGVGPVAYATELRLRDAAFYLRSTERPVQEVAALVNHADTFNFSKLFKRHYGVSPSEFRAAGAGRAAP